jgi:hypothetical protein
MARSTWVYVAALTVGLSVAWLALWQEPDTEGMRDKAALKGGAGDGKDDTKVAPLAAQVRVDTGAAVTEPAKAWEIEGAVRAVFAAFNNRDADAFLAGWTDEGFRKTFQQSKQAAKRSFPNLPALAVLEPFMVGEFSNTAVGRDTASTEVELTQSNVKKTHWLSLVKDDNAWKIDTDKEIATRIPADGTLVPVTMTESAFQLDTSAVTKNVAFQVFNAGPQKHDFSVFMLRDSGMEVHMGGAESLEPGEGKTVLLTNLAPGRYAVLCNRLDADGQPYSAKGMRAEFTIAAPPGSRASEDQTDQPEGASDDIAPPR